MLLITLAMTATNMNKIICLATYDYYRSYFSHRKISFPRKFVDRHIEIIRIGILDNDLQCLGGSGFHNAKVNAWLFSEMSEFYYSA